MMKKYILLAAVMMLGVVGTTQAAYQQQGFSQFTEKGDTIDFRCEKSCVLLLGEKANNDIVSVEGGTRQGGGMWGYGYLVGSQVFAATVVPARSYEWSFSDDPIYKQLPSDAPKQVVFLVSGPLKVEGVKVSMAQRSGADKIGRIWNRFRTTENLAPYSINLHYGPNVGGWSWPVFALIVMLVAVVIIAIRKKLSFKKIVRLSIITLIALMIVGGVRLLIDDFRIVSQNNRAFDADKTAFDLGNYVAVTEQIRAKLDLDNIEAQRGKTCTIYAKANSDWPFVAHWGSVYLRPCTLVQTGSMADYHLYYNIAPQTATGTLILTGDNFTLFDVRS